jgi:hypothetical protein
VPPLEEELLVDDVLDPLIWVRRPRLLSGAALEDRLMRAVEQNLAAVGARPLPVRAPEAPLYADVIIMGG